jgi:hypothetical protein
MPCFFRGATDGVEPGRERSKQIRGRMESFCATDKVVIGIVLISFATGCTTMRSLPSNDAQSIASQLKVGDNVQITRSDASVVKFKVEAISNEGLTGDGILVAYSDILQVRVREHSTAKTVGLVVAILVIVKGLSTMPKAPPHYLTRFDVTGRYGPRLCKNAIIS